MGSVPTERKGRKQDWAEGKAEPQHNLKGRLRRLGGPKTG